MFLKKDLWEYSNVSAAIDVLSSFLWGYITVSSSLLELGYQHYAILQPILKTFVLHEFGWPVCYENSISEACSRWLTTFLSAPFSGKPTPNDQGCVNGYISSTAEDNP